MTSFIRTNRIIAAFPDNVCDFEKVNLYAEEMKDNDISTGHHGFPAILGYFDQVNENDFGKVFNPGDELKEERIKRKHLGIEIFRVTDGNHRFLAAVKAEIWGLETEDDNSGFVTYKSHG